MNARPLAPAVALALLAGTVSAQGYGDLGEELDKGYAEVTPDYAITFPRDHGAHPDFRIEWWYVTANLRDTTGRRYGTQFTLFRQAGDPPPQRSGWASQQFWLGHAAATSAETHRYADRIARGGVGQAGVTLDPFRAWIDDWQMRAEGASMSSLRLTAQGPDFGYELTLMTDKPFVLQGKNGYSVKSERGQASHYYSQPFWRVSGEITLEGSAVAVEGRAWMDREWSSQPLAPDQTGWDWLALHLPRGEKLMVYRLRQDDGNHFLTGNWISASGTNRYLAPGAIRMSPLSRTEIAGRAVPTRWRIEIPSRGLRITVSPLNPRAWMGTDFAYWEGPIHFEGTHRGVGYLELTGY